MSYLLFLVVVWIVGAICAKYGLELPDTDTLMIIAILTAGEVISLRKK